MIEIENSENSVNVCKMQIKWYFTIFHENSWCFFVKYYEFNNNWCVGKI